MDAAFHVREVAVQADEQPVDLVRLKWLDPNDVARFERKQPAAPQDVGNEAVLQNISMLTDEIFGYLSVYEQFPEATARGAVARTHNKLGASAARDCLIRAEQELWSAYKALRDERDRFVERQFTALDMDARREGLKLHVGSAGCTIDGWLNIDAGGADLALNINWGLPFADNSVDFIFSAHVLEHLRYGDQAPAFVRDCFRVLKPGGAVRFVVPDLRKLLTAYSRSDADFFSDRHRFYPLNGGFMNGDVANLDYVLLYSGAGPQNLNLNHKFGYDSRTLCKLLLDAGFSRAAESGFQASAHPELRVDEHSFDTKAVDRNNQHFSLFVEAVR